MNFSHLFLICILVPALRIGAADVRLSEGSKLSGELISLNKEGIITLKSPASSKPLKVNLEKVLGVLFEPSVQPVTIPEQRLKLINGDSFPVTILSLDNKILRAISPVLGDMEIPRNSIDSLELGIIKKQLIYSGPKDFKGWERDSDGENSWNIDDGELVSSGQGLIMRNMDLPEKFVIRFKLSWDTKPYISLYFADPLNIKGEMVDRYLLQYNTHGFELRRESAIRRHSTLLAKVSRNPNENKNSEIEIEIRMNRKEGFFELYLDGHLQGKYVDPIPNFPSGSGIGFYSQTRDHQAISNIEISKWEGRADRFRENNIKASNEDLIIGSNGEQFGGNLLTVKTGEDGLVYVIKSDFQKNLIELPESEVASIIFAGEDKKEAEEKRFLFNLQGEVRISADSCEFEAQKIRINHPLLGLFELDRSGIKSFTHTQNNNPDQP